MDQIARIKKELGNSSDLIVRELDLHQAVPLKMAVVYFDGLADAKLIQEFINEVLLVNYNQRQEKLEFDPFSFVKHSSNSTGEVKTVLLFSDLIKAILTGDTAIIIDGYEEKIIMGTKSVEDRGITEPSSQNVVRGPKDSFTETLRTNTSLIRRRIKSSSLRVDAKQVGKITKTDVALVYMEGIVDQQVVDEVHKRINNINIDSILESGYIEELIQDEAYTPFPTIYNTERPDSIVAGILEGRVAIIVDGTPFVLLVPAIFVQFLQSSEDYYQRSDYSTLIRMLRFASFLLTLLVPSSYIAVTNFHQEMLPTPLLISLAATREGIPFPAIVEVLIMEATFEILREAGVRLPRAVGSAISIVGALVIGEAAVQAGLVSPAMVIIVSFTAITSFVIPSYNLTLAVRMLRFGFMLIAAVFGLYGIILGILALVLHLTSLRSFGVPYLEGFGPFNLRDQKDSLFRFPLKMLKTRPNLIGQNDEVREPSNDTSNTQ
ncbi:spore germination protein [Peribacillus acanthi]|uniref:spore germination protein n=1 Tax=Peribacillus acanthi TaxID=2171554 RepID=UPI000D3EB63A